MDLLSRRTSGTSRRGTLLPGGARRQGSGGSSDSVGTSKPFVKTALLDEFRAHEEGEAARVLQRAARGFLGRKFVAKLLQQVYRRQYDPIEKQYYYVNTATNETTWDKPRALRMFLSETQDVPVAIADSAQLSTADAARRIQRLVRAFLAKHWMHSLVCETYMKLFDESTKQFYYLNTRTGAQSDDRPSFLGTDDAHDIPVETFQFRKAVVKVSSTSHLYGSGVLGYFGPGARHSIKWLCLLSDATTLPDAATASTAHVVCSYCTDGGTVPFQVALRPERFFTTLTVEPTHAPPQFTLCAVDAEAFKARAGTNIEPLQLEMTDRKMACAEATHNSLPRDAAIEIVGHPHGKPRVVHSRTLAKMLPHSIAPLKIQYDHDMETGSAGCAVFTRGGKLLGLQAFTPLKAAAPRECYYMRPILDAASALVTPPEPFLLTTRLSSNDVHVCWSIVRWFKPLPGLAIEYELELGRVERNSVTAFACVYRGRRQCKHVGNLESESLYSLRVRACNPIGTGAWSHVLTFRTLPTPSIAWRIPRYCTSVRDACDRMRQQQHDAVAQVHGVQWIARHLEQHLDHATEAEVMDVDAIDWMLETVTTRFPMHDVLPQLTLRVLTTLARFQHRSQRLLSQVTYMQTILDLFKRHLPPANPEPSDPVVNETPDDPMAIPLACVELLGAVLDGDNNGSAQQTAQALEVIPTLLKTLAADDNRVLRTHAPFVDACVFLTARYSHRHTLSGKWQLVTDGRLVVLRDLLEEYATTSASVIVYWTLVTLGNIAYASTEPVAREELEFETRRLQLVAAICVARSQFLLRLRDLELAVGAAEREYARLAASVMGDAMRNELDACEHEIQSLQQAIQDLHDHGDVADAADFALRYLLTDEQRRVQAAATRLMHQYLYRQLAAAVAKWREFTVFERHCAIFRAFLTTVRHRQLSAAFRKWEQFLHAWRRAHKSRVVDAVLGTGLAIDLNKRKKEQYRIVALQK